MPDPQVTQDLNDILQRMIAFYRGMGPECDNRSAYRDIPALQIEEVAKANPGAVVLDVRTTDEFEEGHIPGSRLMTFTEIPQRYETLPPRETPLIVSCQQGVRSRIACNMLARLGYTKLFNVIEGMNGWTGPVETGA
jgi:rhodanese-related sulfurtransferase